jgi:hypothetical protein
MLVIHAKSGLNATLEKVFAASGSSADFKIIYVGTGAKVCVDDSYGYKKATVYLPALDDGKELSRSRFNQLLAYVLHELGHVWFTKQDKWQLLTDQFIAKLTNGLEDPRIEQQVIDSGYAPNAKPLFEALVNTMLAKGYVEPGDLKNVPFLLAIEGRRLNGYQIDVPSAVEASPWASDIRWALKAARIAADTDEVVDIATELARRLRQQQEDKPEEDKPEEKPEDKPEQGESEGGEADGESEDGEGESDEGEGKGQQPGGNSKGARQDEIPVEPQDHIAEDLSELLCTADFNRQRPIVGKVKEIPFEFI